MLKADYYLAPTAIDLLVFEKLIPADPYRRRRKAAINCAPLRELVADGQAEGRGAPAEDPVRLLNRALLEFPQDLSERAVLQQAPGNVAFRFFLDCSRESPLPGPRLRAQFRERRGVERFTRGFKEILRQGREQGLVRARLRLKAATPRIANLASPSPLRLVAQPREQVLAAAACCAASAVTAPRAQGAVVRTATADWPAEQRRLARVIPLHELVVWGEQGQERLRQAAAGHQPVVRAAPAAAFSAALAVARTVLNDRAPEATDKRLALADRDACTGKHGDYYEGSLLEVSREADAELIGAVAVRPANGDEGANAKPLSASAEHAPGNALVSLSVDRIGYGGDVLAALRDETDGPHLTVQVPPIDWPPPAPELFHPPAFTLNEAGDEGRAPGGAPTGTRRRAQRGHGGHCHCRPSQGRPCPVRAQCLKPETPGGRTVSKHDYEAHYRAAQPRAQTAAYQAVRREQPRIERKLAEIIRWHDGRRARYRGQRRVKIQYLLTAVVVNGKRIGKLLSSPLQPQSA